VGLLQRARQRLEAGAGTVQHVAIEMLMAEAKFKAVHVPYKGIPEMLRDAVSGQIKYAFPPIGNALPFVKDNRLVALAVSTAHAQSAATRQATERVRTALERLPSYGVFDSLAFEIDQNTVTLSGYAYTGSLKSDASRAVTHLEGIEEVLRVPPRPVHHLGLERSQESWLPRR